MGGLGFAHTVRLRAARTLRALAVLVFHAALILLGAQAMDLAGSGAAPLLSGSAWSAAATGPFGLTSGLAVVAAGLALRFRAPLAGWLALMLGRASFAASGHAASAASRPPFVVALHAAFRLTPPPRAAATTGIDAHLHGGESGGDLQVSPARAGLNSVLFYPHAHDMGPLDPLAVSSSFRLAEQDLGPLTVEGLNSGGLWTATLPLPAAVDWDVVVSIWMRTSLRNASEAR